MVLTRQELDGFHEFATGKVNAGEVGLSLERLVSQWQATRQQTDTDTAIREAIDQMNAGLGEPLDDAMEDIRQRLNIPAE